MLIEEDCVAGRLHHVDVLYVTQPHLTDSAAAGIATWVAAGGQVFATAGAGLLNEANATNAAMAKLLGVTQTAVFAGTQDEFNNTVRLIKQDINFVEALDNVSISTSSRLRPLEFGDPASALVAKGVKSIFTAAAGSKVLATFSDGKPAMIKTAAGSGSAFYAGFMPGLAYFSTAIPLRPVDRSSVDEGMNRNMVMLS